MYDLKACIVCLSTDVKLFNMRTDHLRQVYNQVSGLQTAVGNGMPDYLCYECTAYVRRFKKFRDKCQRTHYILQEILQRNKEINKCHVSNLNRENLGIAPTLSYIDTNICHYHETKFQWTKLNRSGVKGERIPTVKYNTITDSDTFDTFTNVEIKINEKDIKTDVAVPKEVSDKCEDIGASTSIVELTDSFIDNGNDSDNDNGEDTDIYTHKPCKLETDDAADGSVMDEEYATMVPISKKDAKAAVEVYRMFSTGKYKCYVCHKGYSNENRLNIHMRMHDKHVSGNFLCELCNYYYKTEFLLTTHMTQKHMYKYLCKKCPEVNFDRTSAKQHYIWSHLQKGDKKNANWYDTRPTWMSTKGGKRVKGVVALRPVRKLNKLPEDFLIYSPIGHEEQYTLVLDRQKTRNYKEAKYRCHLCYRGFQVMSTYNNHMKKHDPEVAGPLECDVCKVRFRNQRKMYKHMIITHLFKYSCQLCSYVCYNRGQAHMHYRWHKNVTYKCPHCDKEFKKMSTRLTHIRIKHPSLNICPMCGHSFVSETGLYHHKLIVHSKEEIELINIQKPDIDDPHFCADCGIQFMNELAFTTHLGSSNKHADTNLSIQSRTRVKSAEQRAGAGAGGAGAGAGGAGAGGGAGGAGARGRGRPRRLPASEILNNGATTATTCEVCGVCLPNDVQARRHYEAEHPGTEFLKRYMCDVCGHTTRQYANLMVHMRTHTNEKPYGCLLCDRRFSMPSNRDRHMVVHTGEKRYQCQHCNRRFTQSTAVKLHIQTVHLKIPYAPWDKKNRKRRKEAEGAANFISTDTAECMQPQRKLMFEPQGDYLNAYITYNDE